jgi:hypothetical protein
MNRRRLVLWGTPPLVIALVAIILFVACSSNSGTSIPGTGDAPAMPEVAKGPDYFEDVTAKAGIKHHYRNDEEKQHMAILESLGGGGALIDFDGDGKYDIFVCGGGYYDKSNDTYAKEMKAYAEAKSKDPNAVPPKPPVIHGNPGKLYRNKGNFEFEDVTDKVGLDKQPDFYTHGAAVADYDRDGWPDLLVTGYGRVALYHNVPDGKGGRKFVDVTEEAGLLGPDPKKLSEESGQPGPHFWSTSAAWADLDGDGYPDLYLCQYVDWSFLFDKEKGIDHNPACAGYSIKIPRDVCPPKQFNSTPHALWKNNGVKDGKSTFTNVTKEAGLRIPPRKDNDYGKGLGVLILDVDGDGKPDIYVCNDTTDNFLYLNKSTRGNLRFEEKGLEMGVARDYQGTANGSMGVWAADFDGSGRPAIWVTNYESEYHALYRGQVNNGRLSYTFNTQAAGLSKIGPNFVGFGTVFADVDGDGWEDIVIANGHVVHFPPRDNKRQEPILFMNLEHEKPKGARWFAKGNDRGGEFFKGTYRGRGLALGDLNNDGRPDLVFFPVNEPVRVLRNICQENHWLGVELKAKGHADVVGARLTLDVGDRKLVRFAMGGGSYLSAHDPRKLFGLGPATKVGKLKVEWPSGEPRVQEIDGLAIDKYHVIEQK